MKKIIGVTPRLLTEKNVEKQFVNTRYIDQLTKRGYNTILLTLDNPNNEAIFAMCDGFLITGGNDLDPSTYGEKNNGLSKSVDKRLDRLDKAVIDYAKKHELPLLGICRGQQSLNVFLGGTLHQDLGELNSDHKRVSNNHKVKITPHPLIDLKGEITVNSYHHQAIKDLAPDLKATGVHDDGTIEMVVHESLPIFAVQWHPEIKNDLPYSNIIFNTFLKLVENN